MLELDVLDVLDVLDLLVVLVVLVLPLEVPAFGHRMIHRCQWPVRPAFGLAGTWRRYRPSPPASALTSILASRWPPQSRRKSPTASSERVQPIHTAREESISLFSRHSPATLHSPSRLPSLCLQPAPAKPRPLPCHTALVPAKTHPNDKQTHPPTASISQRPTRISSPTPLPSLPHSSHPRRVPTATSSSTSPPTATSHHLVHLGPPSPPLHAPTLDPNNTPITPRTSLAPVSADPRSAPTGDSALS